MSRYSFARGWEMILCRIYGLQPYERRECNGPGDSVAVPAGDSRSCPFYHKDQNPLLMRQEKQQLCGDLYEEHCCFQEIKNYICTIHGWGVKVSKRTFTNVRREFQAEILTWFKSFETQMFPSAPTQSFLIETLICLLIKFFRN